MQLSPHFKAHGRTYLYIVSILIVCTPIFLMDFTILLDSPTHAYNASIFNRLLDDDPFVKTYFQMNEQLTSNFISTLLLSSLLRMFSAVVALKLFHLIYILLFAVSFRYWIRSITGEDKLLFIAVPLIISQLYLNGFYSFTLGLPVLFLVLGVNTRLRERKGWRYGLLTVLFIVLYFSHSLVFIIGLLAVGVEELMRWKIEKRSFKSFLTSALGLFIAALPGILILIYFVFQRQGDAQYRTIAQLVEGLFSVSSILPKKGIGELVKWISFISILILSIRFFYLHKTRLSSKDVPGITALFILALYFIFPDSVGYASVFSIRIEYFFWIFLLVWVIVKIDLDRIGNYIVGVLFFAFILFQTKQAIDFWKPLNHDVKKVLEAQSHIPDERIVYPIFASNVWEHFHVSNYLGIDKNLLILENNEATHDYFPILYTEPYEDLLNEKPRLEIVTAEAKSLKINYVLVVGKESIDQERDKIIFELAKQNGALVFQNELVELWEIH